MPPEPRQKKDRDGPQYVPAYFTRTLILLNIYAIKLVIFRLEEKMRKVPTSKFPFYVFDIVDPRSSDVFYVGCGRGNRIIKTINPKHAESSWKRKRLESIIRAGHTPMATIVLCFATMPEALIFERARQIKFRLTPEDIMKREPVPSIRVASTRRRRIEDRLKPISSWCGHPHYNRECRFLPHYCVPRIG